MTDLTVDQKPRRRKWTDEALLLEAQKYRTRKEFEQGSKRAYQAARSRGLLADVCDHMASGRFLWSDEDLHRVALKYETRSAFQRGSKRAYQAARSRGILDVICRHMASGRFLWGDEDLHRVALSYETRIAFARGSQSAYKAARSRGLLDTICQHMQPANNPPDAVYLWRIKGTDIYKVGITSSIYGLWKMFQVSEAGGFQPELIIQTTTKCRPHQVERQVLSLGRSVSFPTHFNGHTEFRQLTDQEVSQAVGIITSSSWLN